MSTTTRAPAPVPPLRTRKPTGAVPWPLVLIEGGEKCGKTWAAAFLTASKRIGQSFWLDLAEGAADEYGAIPGASYEILDHDGTWDSIIGQVAAARAEAHRAADAGEPPVLLVVDSGTAEWEFLKDWASARARNTKNNRKILAENPGAEISVPQNCWNDAGERHRRFMTMLMTFHGIVVIIARGGEVALVENGKPVEGRKTYRVEGHKYLGNDVTVWVRLSRTAKPVIVGARSVHYGVRPGIDDPRELPDDWTLERLIFDVLRCDPAKAHARNLTEMQHEALSPEQIRDEACDKRTDVHRLRVLYRIAARMGYKDEVWQNETGDDENLIEMIERLAAERKPVRAADAGQPCEPAVEPGHAVPSGPAPDSGDQDDDALVAGLAAQLAEAEGDGRKLGALRAEIGKAKLAGDLSPQSYSELSGKVDEALGNLGAGKAGKQ